MKKISTYLLNLQKERNQSIAYETDRFIYNIKKIHEEYNQKWQELADVEKIKMTEMFA